MQQSVGFSKKYGAWALVTGSSAGIGKEFARQLAARGLNLALVARRGDLLRDLAAELESTYAIQTRVIPCDLSQTNFLEEISSACVDLEIGLLVNNAGAPSFHGRFLSRSIAEMEQTLHFSIHVQLHLIRHFAAAMAQRRRGGIVQVSSISGNLSMPFMAEYSASKGYQLQLGESLHYELKDYGIDVIVLSPGATHSERINFGMQPEPVVAAALDNLGRLPSVIPGWRNQWSAFKRRHFNSRKQVVQAMGDFQRGRLQPPHDIIE
ncbi:SDR family NAD(P)-dependent oxidoreductase [Halieaceae bacterium IMCC14734]|uniref:SDR family NAD(P)-dependent oxidoreductase n=1 Tax=Candidatus Litorirhabdus singularis TaxID=2518993 RepID=A0ABT3TJV1_9GAMM|nr:SDR family NAD(P)-dependent oxidoreductase [Candidatus Litorirhabdus singularis]MCX2982500.1 SDR family NAD(P)-dependent oxidoreductase [Candidatus Litorirhabdus singularis]